jgi:hypothetical protein
MFRLFFGLILTLIGLNGAVDYYAYDLHGKYMNDPGIGGWYVILTAVILAWGMATLITSIARRREWLG